MVKKSNVSLKDKLAYLNKRIIGHLTFYDDIIQAIDSIRDGRPQVSTEQSSKFADHNVDYDDKKLNITYLNRNQIEYDRAQEKNAINSGFNKLEHWRRIATHYDKRSIYFLGALYIVAAVIWGI